MILHRSKGKRYFSSIEVFFAHNGKMGGSELQERLSPRMALPASAVQKSALTAGSGMIVSGAREDEQSS